MWKNKLLLEKKNNILGGAKENNKETKFKARKYK